ncbi:plant UBX domain-containing protein 8 [Euphorbia lathyris]|uniref:plant UBX domain-containing protein 8 n=1 Tax=Euphorbia lathyris TaxID=212925 RepID=UPI003313C8C3
MAGPNQEAIDTFISITGATEAAALQKLEEYHGDLNAAINAHFTEGDRSIVQETSVLPSQGDLMDIDDPIEVAPRRNPLSLLSEASAMNPFSLLDPQFRRGIFDGGSDFSSRTPFVSLPRERREIPIEVKDGSDVSSHSGHAPVIEDVTGTEHAQDPGIRGTVIIDEDADDFPTELTGMDAPRREQRVDGSGGSARNRNTSPSVPEFDNPPDYGNDIEEEMVRAAIEASKLEAEAMEREKALLELRGKVGASETGASKSEEVELGTTVMPNGRVRSGTLSIPDESEDVEEQPLVRHRSRRTSSGSMDSIREVGVAETSPPSSPRQNNSSGHMQHNGTAFPTDEWGGISSEEHDEAVMLEAAMFGGIPEATTGYRFPFAPHQFMQTEGGSYPRPAPRPPSPNLQAQRLIREQQDDEYLASLAADREKEIKAREEAEARRLLAAAAREAAVEEERRKENESLRKLEEEQEFERKLAAKEASLPQEPETNDENAVTLLVRMPDGTRRGRRFLKSDNLKSLFDFIDIGRAVKPGSYRLVRPYPRRAFSEEENAVTLNELGLTSKQEALFLELI